MSVTPPAVLQTSATAAEVADRVAISQQGDAFRLELRGLGEDGAVGMVKRDELQRIMQLLHVEVGKAGWLAVPGKPQAAPAAAPSEPNPFRN